MEGINPEHKSAQSQTSTLLHYLSCFLITCWPKQWNIPQHKICVRLTSLWYLILVPGNTILLHMLVLKPRFNSKSAWIEGIRMHTLTTVMVGQTIIIWHITVHKVLHTHGFNYFHYKQIQILARKGDSIIVLFSEETDLPCFSRLRPKTVFDMKFVLLLPGQGTNFIWTLINSWLTRLSSHL